MHYSLTLNTGVNEKMQQQVRILYETSPQYQYTEHATIVNSLGQIYTVELLTNSSHSTSHPSAAYYRFLADLAED